MKRLWIAVIITFLASNAIAQTDFDTVDDPNKERLGLRIGYVGTSSDMHNVFGGGLDLSLHFIQRITGPLFVDVSFGALYMGGTSRDDITAARYPLTQIDDESLRVIKVTVAPMFETAVTDRTTFYILGGVGFYSMSLLLESGFLAADDTDNHLGVNGGTGLIYRMTQNWMVEFNLQVHKLWTDDEKGIFFDYSDGDSDPLFYNIDVGVMLRLF